MPNSSLIRCASCKTINRIPLDKISQNPRCGQCKASLVIPAAPVHASTGSFDQELAAWPGHVLVEFWAKWCGYCRIIEPVVNDLASWKKGVLKVLKVDVDAEPALAQRYTVKATPTFIYFNKGTQQGRIDGAPKEKIELVQWVEQFLKS